MFRLYKVLFGKILFSECVSKVKNFLRFRNLKTAVLSQSRRFDQHITEALTELGIHVDGHEKSAFDDYFHTLGIKFPCNMIAMRADDKITFRFQRASGKIIKNATVDIQPTAQTQGRKDAGDRTRSHDGMNQFTFRKIVSLSKPDFGCGDR